MTVTTTQSRAGSPTCVLALATLAALGLSSAVAADWPSFKPGVWTFERTLTGTGAPAGKVSSTECVDPTADQEKQQDMLAKAGCQFTPITKNGKTYRYSATCKMGGMTSKSDSVLEVLGDEAYTLTVDSTVNGTTTHEVLQARRTGDCKK
jgi:hypothetical protein